MNNIMISVIQQAPDGSELEPVTVTWDKEVMGLPTIKEAGTLCGFYWQSHKTKASVVLRHGVVLVSTLEGSGHFKVTKANGEVILEKKSDGNSGQSTISGGGHISSARQLKS